MRAVRVLLFDEDNASGGPMAPELARHAHTRRRVLFLETPVQWATRRCSWVPAGKPPVNEPINQQRCAVVVPQADGLSVRIYNRYLTVI